VNRPRVVIIGGGIAGLAAAYFLKQICDDGTVECILMEQSARLGGNIYTHRENNLILDLGADAIFDKQGIATELIQVLGVTSEIAYHESDSDSLFILTDGQLSPLPQLTPLGCPVNLASVWHNTRLSFRGKVRVLADFMKPSSKHRTTGDESLGEMLHRRFGNEWLTKVAQPFLTAVWGGKLNAGTTTHPHLLCHAMFNHCGEAMTLHNGLQTLIEQMFDALREFADIRTGHSVSKIQALQGRQYVLEVRSGDRFETVVADAVIMAIPASSAGQLLSGIVPKAATLSAIRSLSTATVFLGYPTEAITHFDGTGLVVDEDETSLITSCSLVSRRWPHTSPEELTLIRCNLGQGRRNDWGHWNDDQLGKEVQSELSEILHLSNRPLFSKVMRWENAIPHYQVGQSQRIEEVEQALQTEAPGIYLAGAGFHGATIPDCIESGRRAASAVRSWFAAGQLTLK
jgi:protoporphyrinogen/coproporphyrinogen III oxidase